MSQSEGSPTPAEPTTSKRKKGQRKHPKLFAFFKWSAITFTVLFVVMVVAGYIFYRSVDIPEPNAEFQTETTYVYYSDGETVLGKFDTQNRESVELEKIPDVMQNAAIAAEDRTFYENRGIDFEGIVRAAWNNATTDTTQGASTITQQYVKILYLTQDQTYTRKAKEAVLSLKIQNERSKEEILEGYLNAIYFGRGAYGVQTAAQAFFNVDVEDLNLRQSAVLASVLNSPSAYDPANGKEARRLLKERYTYVLNGMADMDVISEKRAERAQKRLPKFPDIESKDRFGGPKGHLLRMVETQLQKRGFSDSQINGGGLDVVTTFDVEDQKAARRAVREQRKLTGLKEAAGKDGTKGLHIGLASVENDTGALHAMYGGPDYLENQYNWALNGAQPGSTFKPFAVAAALDNGYSLQTSLDGNSPITMPDGTALENQFNESYGYVSLLHATELSINTAFLDLMMQMEDGPRETVKAARKAGIPVREVFSRDQRRNAPWVTPLGYAPTSVIDMANAYSTFVNDGVRHKWYVIESVEDSSGDSVYEHRTRSKRAFSSDVAADVSYALQRVVSNGVGSPAQTICPTGGKTGTATATDADGDGSHVSSAWFNGVTPEFTTAVMYVRGPNGNGDLQYRNDGSTYMYPYYGSGYPADTFKAYMDEALEGTECGEFAEPAYVDGDEGETYYEPETEEYTPEDTPDDTIDPGLDPTPTPDNTGPTDNGPTSPGPTSPGPTSPGPTSPGPTSPGPTSPGPTSPGPTDPGPTSPGPTDPGPSTPPPDNDGGDNGGNGNGNGNGNGDSGGNGNNGNNGGNGSGTGNGTGTGNGDGGNQ